MERVTFPHNPNFYTEGEKKIKKNKRKQKYIPIHNILIQGEKTFHISVRNELRTEMLELNYGFHTG